MERVLVIGLENENPFNVSERVIAELHQQELQDRKGGTLYQILPAGTQQEIREFNRLVESWHADIVLVLGSIHDQSAIAFEVEARSQNSTISLPNHQLLIPTINNITGLEISVNSQREQCRSILANLINLSNEGEAFQPALLHLIPEAPKQSSPESLPPNTMLLKAQVEIVQKVLAALRSGRKQYSRR